MHSLLCNGARKHTCEWTETDSFPHSHNHNKLSESESDSLKSKERAENMRIMF